jgi:peptide subunit release factor RF-3
MPLEQAREISVTASALEVEYGECRIHCNSMVSI